MPGEFPYLYPHSSSEAQRSGETQMHMDSFYENVKCARAIEQAVRDHFDEANEALTDGCAQAPDSGQDSLSKSSLEDIGFV